MSRDLDQRSDEGSALLIALIFVVALGLVLGSIATFARGSLTNTINLTNQRTTELQASNAVAAAMQNVRRTYTAAIYTSPAGTECLPNSTALPGNPFYVYCVGTSAPGSIISRSVSFYACTTSASCVGSPNSVALFALVLYDDIPPNATPVGFSDCGQAPAGTSTCGVHMTVASWDLKIADG